MSPSLLDAHFRHSMYYQKKLKFIESLYYQGFNHAKESLDLFDLESKNIQTGFLWISSYAQEDEKTLKLCQDYALSGNEVLSI